MLLVYIKLYTADTILSTKAIDMYRKANGNTWHRGSRNYMPFVLPTTPAWIT